MFNKEIKSGSEIPSTWFKENPQIPLEPVIISNDKLIDGYRNKVEFTVGRGFSVKDAPPAEICVGFNRGNMSKGIIFVDKPDNIRVNSAESLEAAKKFEAIVK